MPTENVLQMKYKFVILNAFNKYPVQTEKNWNPTWIHYLFLFISTLLVL